MNFKFEKHQKALEYALKQIKESPILPYVKNAYLYGSCARGDENWDSDVDLLVIVDDIVEEDDNLRLSARFLQGNCSLLEIDDAEVDMHIICSTVWDGKNTTYLNEIRKDGLKIVSDVPYSEYDE